ncbi:acyl-CoA thioesterase [Pseudomonas mangrovi]|jgi:acyl-CoA thioester hydrolase|uniref:MFS transporter n=1 Tax=Pseudomonas mangrovi TaxID=2161748 RepID=A0A2T5P5Q6_9PSED|nr:thioesterase family protein [Pseudomonas mangrovi]PTU73071.1 MFS transporter [Pseudomonas mangrovi]
MSLPRKADFRFSHSLRVRWAEVDPQGIVFNGNYLTYADVGITEYFRALRVAYPEALTEGGCDFYAIKTTLEYKAPAHFDRLLDVAIRVARLGRSSLTFEMTIWDGETLLTIGEIVYVHARSEPRSSAPLPDWLRERIREFEISAPQE